MLSIRTHLSYVYPIFSTILQMNLGTNKCEFWYDHGKKRLCIAFATITQDQRTRKTKDMIQNWSLLDKSCWFCEKGKLGLIQVKGLWVLTPCEPRRMNVPTTYTTHAKSCTDHFSCPSQVLLLLKIQNFLHFFFFLLRKKGNQVVFILFPCPFG